MRKEPFLIGQYYHIYNRGTDKRIIFKNKQDLERFLMSIKRFNTLDPIGHIRYGLDNPKRNQKLVDIICYSLNPNHYHLILSPLVENGIEKFMQKLGAGYTLYINEKYKRSGVLLQGKFKSILIKTDKYLMYLSAYVNLNNKIHFLSRSNSKKEKLFYKSSWDEFIKENKENKENICNKAIILDRYEGNISEYKEFAESVAKGIIERRIDLNINLDEDILIEKIK